DAIRKSQRGQIQALATQQFPDLASSFDRNQQFQRGHGADHLARHIEAFNQSRSQPVERADDGVVELCHCSRLSVSQRTILQGTDSTMCRKIPMTFGKLSM